MKILIAEDNPLWRKTLVTNIEQWGYDVVVAEDGEQAWEILHQEDAPRLALLDWEMPGRDGIDICRNIKQNQDLPFTYVIMLSGRESQEDMVVGLDAGADDYLTKPIEPVVLRSRLLAAGRIVQIVPPKEWTVPQVDGYEVKQLLGKGAFATVWDATQQSTGQNVALKIIRVDLVTDEMFDRFGHEIQLMYEMDHPNIARVYDSQLNDKFGYFAMERVDGWTLEEYVEQEKPKAVRLIYLLSKVCSALQHAHDRGVVHRDLKPTNILVDSDHKAKLVDFGLGKSMFRPETGSGSSADIEGSVIGTPLFMAPEQARGENDKVDGRTDIYALGIVLFVMFVRRHPHDIKNKNRWQTVQQIASGEVSRPSDLVPGFDGDLEQIIMKALEDNPDNRYQSANELEKALRKFVKHRLDKKKRNDD